MIVMLHPSGRVALAEPHVFRSFRVDVAAYRSDLETLCLQWPGMVRFDDADVAWVSIAGLGGLDDVRDDTGWQAGLAAMIDAARPHGWIDDIHQMIRAHVTWIMDADGANLTLPTRAAGDSLHKINS